MGGDADRDGDAVDHRGDGRGRRADEEEQRERCEVDKGGEDLGEVKPGTQEREDPIR